MCTNEGTLLGQQVSSEHASPDGVCDVGIVVVVECMCVHIKLTEFSVTAAMHQHDVDSPPDINELHSLSFSTSYSLFLPLLSSSPPLFSFLHSSSFTPLSPPTPFPFPSDFPLLPSPPYFSPPSLSPHSPSLTTVSPDRVE